MTEDKDVRNAQPDPLDVLSRIENIEPAQIEAEITNLEQRLDRLRKLLHVRRGLSPRAKTKGRKRASAGVRTQSNEPPVPAET